MPTAGELGAPTAALPPSGPPPAPAALALPPAELPPFAPLPALPPSSGSGGAVPPHDAASSSAAHAAGSALDARAARGKRISTCVARTGMPTSMTFELTRRQRLFQIR